LRIFKFLTCFKPHTGDFPLIQIRLFCRICETNIWSIIWEFGSSVDITDSILYLNTDGGIRINPPSLPFLHFDIGVDLEEFPIVEGTSPSATVFFDVLFGMEIR
jgi:hypothetical protein